MTTAPDQEARQLLSEISALRSKLLKLESAFGAYKRGNIKTVEDCIDLVGSGEGRFNLEQVLTKLPYPHYEAAPDEADVLIRIDADGTRTRGHFVGRIFTALAPA